MEYKKLNVALELKISDEDIDDIMVSALERGINYWCSSAEIKGHYLGEYASDQISRGGELILYDAEEEKTHTLNKDKFFEGLRKYISNGNLRCIKRKKTDRGVYIGELSIDTCQIDAVAADSIVQYALFGDVVYG